MYSGAGDFAYLSFKNKEYDYIIYDGGGHDWKARLVWEFRGLFLYKNGKQLTEFACANNAIGGISHNLLKQLDIQEEEGDYNPKISKDHISPATYTPDRPE